MDPTSKAAGRSSSAKVPDTGIVFPERMEQTGKINVRSIIFAPIMLPTDILDSFLIIADKVVTSSGNEVPSATSVTAIMRSGTPNNVARLLPLSTSKREPITIAAAPIKNLTILAFFL